ncbi:MAG: hypothetical protein HY056_10090, partial [Proteobacteria bacterium]|nr:hypothetical protein [Pseudomonadota bacterium]
MKFAYALRAACGVLSDARQGPTLYDVCDPLLGGNSVLAEGGNAHLRRFYRTALGNPALRIVLARAGLSQLRDAQRLHHLQNALRAARDEAAPDWADIARPLAALIDEHPQRHPRPGPAKLVAPCPTPAQIDRIIRACANHLLARQRRSGFIPAYAAFNLVGDADFHGRDLITALQGLDARNYRNATLLFNLARVFILANPNVTALFNPPWQGIAEPLWEPVQIRHRSAYYDAFYAEALMDFIASGAATPRDIADARNAVGQLIDFCLRVSREEAPLPDGGSTCTVVTAITPPPHSRISRFFWRIKQDLGFDIYVPDCDTTACALSAAAQAGVCDPMLDQPLIDFYAGYQVGRGGNRHAPTVAINDTIDYDGGIVTWIENLAGERPFGNDLDPTLNLDVLEASLRNLDRWQIVDNSRRLDVLRGIVGFQRRLVQSGQFANPRAHIYYLPELYC